MGDMVRCMKLSCYTDYALRVLIHMAVRGDESSSIPETARAYAISEDHLRKIVHSLGKAGFVATQRGRGGGIRLALPPVKSILDRLCVTPKTASGWCLARNV